MFGQMSIANREGPYLHLLLSSWVCLKNQRQLCLQDTWTAAARPKSLLLSQLPHWPWIPEQGWQREDVFFTSEVVWNELVLNITK